MSNSIFLARLIGPLLLVVGLVVLANPRGFRETAEEFLASRALMFLAGFVMMPAGLAIVLTHNVWSADWRVLITILGWLTMIGGVIRMFEPPFLLQGGRAMLRRPQFMTVASAIWGVIGLLLCFLGYRH